MYTSNILSFLSTAWRRLSRRFRKTRNLTSVALPPSVHIPHSKERASLYRRVYAVKNAGRTQKGEAALTLLAGNLAATTSANTETTRDVVQSVCSCGDPTHCGVRAAFEHYAVPKDEASKRRVDPVYGELLTDAEVREKREAYRKVFGEPKRADVVELPKPVRIR